MYSPMFTYHMRFSILCSAVIALHMGPLQYTSNNRTNRGRKALQSSAHVGQIDQIDQDLYHLDPNLQL